MLAAGGHQLPLGARALHIVSRLIRIPGHRPGGDRSVTGQAAYHHGQGGGTAAIQGHQAVAVGGAAPAGIPLHQLGEGPPLHRTHRGGRLGVLLPGVADHKVQGLRVADRQLQQLLRIVLRTGQKGLRRRLLPGQRLKLVRYMSSSLTGLTYIFDEPSAGMHPRDVYRMNNLLRQLRDKGQHGSGGGA